MVGPGHPAHDTSAAWSLLAGDRLGTWIDAQIQHRCPPPSHRLVQQTPTDLQRRDRRRPSRPVVTTGFLHVPVWLRKHRNSGQPAKSIRGDSMSRRLKCGKSSLGNFAGLVKQALLSTTASTPIEIWFQDEARVGQKGTHAYIWAPIGSRPLMVRDNRHDSASIFGAICPARAGGAAGLMPAANTEAMNEHLKEISTQVSAGAHAVLVCDRAGWHQRGKQLVVPDNISLLPLPSYSPELNPMENVWDYLRQNKLCAQVWDTYDDILEACKNAWNFLIDDPDRIRSIGTRDWACVNG